MVRFRSLFLACAAISLGACATALESPTQPLAIDVRGTGEAVCIVTQSGYRYRAHAPGSINIQKTSDLLKVKCEAPGNRSITVELDPEVSDMEWANLANGIVPGVTWDYLSGAMHEYPERIVMDFTHIPPKSYDVPDYQKVFAQNPQMISMEEFRPGVAALQSDIGGSSQALPRRMDDAEVVAIPATPSAAPVRSAPVSSAVRSGMSSGTTSNAGRVTLSPGMVSPAAPYADDK